MISSLSVDIVVDGSLVTSAVAAQVVSGTVLAPLHPFVDRLATEIRISPDGKTIELANGTARIEVQIGSRVAHVGTGTTMLPIAPFLRDGRVILPLAPIARALGESVTYDGAGRELVVAGAAAIPLATMTPYAAPVPFVPQTIPTPDAPATPTPIPSVIGIPQPRRTPVAEVPARPAP